MIQINEVEGKLSKNIETSQKFLKGNIEVLPPVALSPQAGAAASKPPDMEQMAIISQMNELKIHADRIGCKLTQEVQAGQLISPIFVFQPENGLRLGMPPIGDMRHSETGNEFQSSQPSGGKVGPGRAHLKVEDADEPPSEPDRQSVLSESMVSKSGVSNEHSSMHTQTLQGKNAELSEH